MCGIAGIVTSVPAEGLDRALSAMRLALRHRGPDGEGEWRAPSALASFAHNRLAVFDTSARGAQPMSIDDRFTISYNGALYNYAAMRQAMEQRGVIFRTATDTEVVLRAYAAEGLACLPRLRGMFAFAIWDERDRTAVIVRDRFGIKPLYYQQRHGRLVFASEVRALLASGLVAGTLDANGLYNYFRTGSVSEPRTLLQNVVTLPAGHYAVWRGGQLVVREYWSMSFSEGAGGDAPQHARESLLDSVASHAAGDRPIGVFLSGGVDSTALVALSRVVGQPPPTTLTMTFPGQSGDEGPRARRTAAVFGTPHEECAVDALGIKALVGQFVAAIDQPSIDGFNTFVMSKFAHDVGMKVVWSGLGADELFGGYPSFTRVPRLASWHRRASVAGPVAGSVGRVIEAVAPGVRLRRLGDLLGQTPALGAAYQTFRAVFTGAESRQLAAHYAGTEPDALAEPSFETDDAVPDAISRLELTRYVRNQLLRDADVMSMRWGIELRTPYLDAGVFDTVARIPAGVRLAADKALLRRAVPEIPPWVSSANKQCFQFPFTDWFAGEWRDMWAGQSRQRVPFQTWYRQWCVFVLERWLHREGINAR